MMRCKWCPLKGLKSHDLCVGDAGGHQDTPNLSFQLLRTIGTVPDRQWISLISNHAYEQNKLKFRVLQTFRATVPDGVYPSALSVNGSFC